MDAMLFAAGLGTRLAPLTDERPKPAVPVANRPLAWFALAHLARAGVTRVIANVHHLPDVAERALADAASEVGVAIEVVREPTLLGTGGGLRNAWARWRAQPGVGDDGTLIVMNSDILFAPDLARAMEVHARLGAIATMVLRDDPNAVQLGAVEVDAEGRVRRLLGKPDATVDLGSLRTTMFTGVHVLSADAFADLPEEGCIIRRTYRKWVDEGRVVAGVVDDGDFRDVGTLEAYVEANAAFARAAGGVLAHDTAVVAPGARLVDVVVGAGARIGRGAELREVVVWDGAEVAPDTRLERAIVTPRGAVRAV